jgi:hypothetical protein
VERVTQMYVMQEGLFLLQRKNMESLIKNVWRLCIQVKRFDCYLRHNKFKAFVDHSALKWLLTMNPWENLHAGLLCCNHMILTFRNAQEGFTLMLTAYQGGLMILKIAN